VQRVVAVPVTPVASIIDVAVPIEMLAGHYELRLCADPPGRVALASGFSVDAPHGLGALAGADIVIVPENCDPDRRPAVLRALRDAAVRGARIVTGSGGRTTADLCHDLVRQAQVTALPTAGGERDLADLLDWATARLDRPLTLTEMARAARVSPRTLTRRFHATLGTTPIQWLLGQRLERARLLLETTSEPVERIARRTGFTSTGNFRQHFARATGMSPQTYRRSVVVAAAASS
jgi:AraC family transcriptional regulator, transcriptional activator FtrA